MSDTKLKHYDKLIGKVARRYVVAGVLDHDDLWQEGRLVLHDMLSTVFAFDHYSDDFVKLLHTRLRHRFLNLLRYQRVKQRDYRKKVWERERYVNTVQSASKSVEEEFLEQEDRYQLDLFLDQLMLTLNHNDRSVLIDICNPKLWSAVPEELVEAGSTSAYASREVLAAMRGWSPAQYSARVHGIHIKAKRALERAQLCEA